MDTDGNGILDEAELAEALKAAGLAAESAQQAAKRLAKGSGGTVEFSRFVAALAPAVGLVDVELLRSSFNRLDARRPDVWSAMPRRGRRMAEDGSWVGAG
eukprot:g25403.t1